MNRDLSDVANRAAALLAATASTGAAGIIVGNRADPIAVIRYLRRFFIFLGLRGLTCRLPLQI